MGPPTEVHTMIALHACLALLASAADPAAVKLGGIYPLTGSYAATGVAMRNGAHLAADEINAAGGVLGKKLVVVDADDASKPEQGAQAVKDLLDKEGAVALIGPANTGVAAAVAKAANDRRVPIVVSNAVGNKVNELFQEAPPNYVFRLAASEALQAQMMVTEACAARGRRKPAILHDETAHGNGGRAKLEALLKERQLAPVYQGGVKAGEQEATAQVQAARAAGADVILLFALAREGAAVTRGLEKLGWKAEVIGTSSLSSSDFTKAAGPFGEGTSLPQTVIEAGATQPVQVKFFESYRKTYATAAVEPAPGAAQSYDAVHLLARALKQAGTTAPDKVKAALENLKDTYDGATAEYFQPWSADDHEAVTPAAVVWGVLHDGKVAPAPSR
ncbi:ABC transporter substrate-binding protein [Anaeromyxobacter diazotrophicus]|uniref:ABC transporter substrate-binding protein n=1 Tax=Anaeromyxobacter diazotrophicus TaxID=2590199 RepID=UPI00158F9FAF|nr:ABC transporter substrate-binding protein [Anaeromyxobacter diazotrophicus]